MEKNPEYKILFHLFYKLLKCMEMEILIWMKYYSLSVILSNIFQIQKG